MKLEQTIYFLQSDNKTVSSGTVVETDGRTYAIAVASTGELYRWGAEQCSTDRKVVYQVAIENVRMALGSLAHTLYKLEKNDGGQSMMCGLRKSPLRQMRDTKRMKQATEEDCDITPNKSNRGTIG